MELHSPLDWPVTQEREHCRERASFDPELSVQRARAQLARELDLLGATDAILSTDVEVTASGNFAARQKRGIDQGIALYYRLDDDDLGMGFDRWDRLEHNIRAAAKTIEALRGIDRWGSGQLQRMAFRGFAALPAVAGIGNWWEVLGVPRDASMTAITVAWRDLAVVNHPDAGGDPERFLAIQQAYAAAKLERAE